MNTKEQELVKVWWEMEEIEPLTPITSRYESNEIPTTVRQTKEEGVL